MSKKVYFGQFYSTIFMTPASPLEFVFPLSGRGLGCKVMINYTIKL